MRVALRRKWRGVTDLQYASLLGQPKLFLAKKFFSKCTAPQEEAMFVQPCWLSQDFRSYPLSKTFLAHAGGTERRCSHSFLHTTKLPSMALRLWVLVIEGIRPGDRTATTFSTPNQNHQTLLALYITSFALCWPLIFPNKYLPKSGSQ